MFHKQRAFAYYFILIEAWNIPIEKMGSKKNLSDQKVWHMVHFIQNKSIVVQMRNVLSKLVLFAINSLMASSLNAIELDVFIAPEYRVDHLCWKVSSLPIADIITEEKWRNIQSVGVFAETDAYICDRIYIQAQGNISWVVDGEKQLDEYGQISFDQDGWLLAHTHGYLYDVSAGFGYLFPFLNECVQIAPTIGFEFSEQKFKDSNYDDTLYLINFFEDVKSSYRYQWMGPWIGTHCTYLFPNWAVGVFEYRFHYIWYHAMVHDNLLGSSRETQNNSHVYGNDFTLKIFSDCWKNWGIGLIGNYSFTNGTNGHNKTLDQTYPLKHVRWSNGKVALAFVLRF